MSQDWPSPRQHEQRDPLPTTHGLPLAGDGGYDRESVDEAFDAFYRHIAQLDTTLRTLESVESFRQQAAELRADLRSIRAAGWTPYPRGYPALPSQGLGAGVVWGLPEALPRLAVEVAFLVAVAVVLAVGGFGTLWIVLAMAVAVAVTVGFEWLATRDRVSVPVPARPQPPVLAAPPAPPVVEGEAVPAADGNGWAAFAEEPAETEEPVDDEEEPEPTEESEPESEPEPVGEQTAEIEATDAEESSFIRAVAPWERGFDGDTLSGKEDEASLPT
jgi:hypothetical protein